jgi:hypothetical protein
MVIGGDDTDDLYGTASVATKHRCSTLDKRSVKVTSCRAEGLMSSLSRVEPNWR